MEQARRRREAERDANAGRTLTVHYPSGSRFTVLGDLKIAPMPGPDGDAGWEMICVDMGDAGIVVLDPRGIVRNAAGERVWGPRDVPLDSHGPFYLEWLIDNPEWDRRS